jgi:hypothetical protein
VTSFGSALDTNMWSTSTSASGSQANQAARVSTSSNQLKLSIAPCTTAAPCNGFNFTAGSVYTKSALWGFGVYTARFKAPSVTGFTAQFEVRVMKLHTHDTTRHDTRTNSTLICSP